jgi:hypothetical protein
MQGIEHTQLQMPLILATIQQSYSLLDKISLKIKFKWINDPKIQKF